MTAVLERGYRQGDRVLRPARVVVSAGPAEPAGQARVGTDHGRRRTRLLRRPGRQEVRHPGRDQEGLPASWPVSTIPTPIPTIPRRRRSSKRSPAPTRCSPTPEKRKQYDAGPSVLRARARRRRRVPRLPGQASRWAATGPTCSATCSAAAVSAAAASGAAAGGRQRAPERGEDVSVVGQAVVRRRAQGRHHQDQRAPDRQVRGLRGQRSGPGHRAGHLSAVPGPGQS